MYLKLCEVSVKKKTNFYKMTKFLDLFQFFDQDHKLYNSFLQDFFIAGYDLPFNLDEIKDIQDAIVSTINNRLNEAITRYNGLLLLNAYLTKCSSKMLSQYGMLWLGKATKKLEDIDNSPQHLNITCKVIGNLISQLKAIPELQKQISIDNVKQIINVMDNLESVVNYGATYYLLATLLHHYPETCERLQGLIRKMIFHQIDASKCNLVNAGAKCFALLIKTTERSFKPPSTKSYYTCWTYNQALICNSLHDIMDSLFSSILETESIDILDKLELPGISEENIFEYYSNQQQRFSNLCIYLSAMLNGCDERSSVLPNDILKILCRGLAIRPINLKKENSIKGQILYLILPKLHISLFNVLSALINGFKKELIPYGSKILQLFHQTLKWTTNELKDQETISSSKPFKNLRLSIYKCLSLWLISTNSLSGIETIVDECLPFVLKDIISERDRVLLTVKNTYKNLSKKAFKRIRDGQYEKSSALNKTIATKKNPCLDADLCTQALITLQNILFSSYLKPTLYVNIQNVIIPLLYEYYLGSSEQTFYKENSQCRLELLRILKNLELNLHTSSTPPTQYALEIFEMALDDANLHIVQEAQCALAELEKIIHPVASTLWLTNPKESIGENKVSHNELNEQESISNEEILSPSKKTAKNNRYHEVTDEPINIDSSKSENYFLQESKSIVNKLPLIEVNDIEKNAEPELQNNVQKDQKSDKLMDGQLEEMEVESLDMDVETDVETDLKEDNSQHKDNSETSEELDDILMDDEKQMLLCFKDQLKDE
ncbi:hypothetical protein M0802_008971 [Mischocyttarus mexicanus]|nr:hypothetical protein M0802_008971 [Mischocyttarus mexicanus]